jgi:diguanylate cyclase (GGDEF)-like protein
MSFAEKEAGRQSNELRIFHDVAKALTSSLDLNTILQTIMEKMAAHFQPEAWCLMMRDEVGGDLYSAAAVGNGCQSVSRLLLTNGESLAEWVMDHGEPMVIADVNHDERIHPGSNQESYPDPCSVVCVPVRTAEKALGVIQLMQIDLAVYQRHEMLLQTMADYAAIAIENARAVHRIQELSITDDCTRLYNARHLYTVLEEEVQRSRRFGYQFTILFLDLDNFKTVNDEHGHLLGSRLLCEVGLCLREGLRLVDTAFRYGGDEFAILLPQTSKGGGLVVARRLLQAFRERRWLADEPVTVSLRASVGVASYPEDASTPESLMQKADEMMYEVKQSGRDNVAVAGHGIIGDTGVGE